ncbi:hypothetical protein [uncultured Croceitalea sp.]|uniref:hypothetical protein n=1 Tax=uncultured Croceitalea sp. TaxID=1798908 RepID=UPI00374E731C
MRVLLFLFFPILLIAQESPQKSDQYFIALYTVGENWDVKKSPGEQLYFKEHSSFLSQLRKDKIIVTGARYSDTGMLILKATDFKTIESMLQQDLAIQNKLFELEIHPYASFYKGCIE